MSTPASDEYSTTVSGWTINEISENSARPSSRCMKVASPSWKPPVPGIGDDERNAHGRLGRAHVDDCALLAVHFQLEVGLLEVGNGVAVFVDGRDVDDSRDGLRRRHKTISGHAERGRSIESDEEQACDAEDNFRGRR